MCKLKIIIEQQISIVEHYINCRKGKEVRIAIRNARDLALLQKAYLTAISWFQENNIEITLN